MTTATLLKFTVQKDDIAQMREAFESQRTAFQHAGAPSRRERIANLSRLERMIQTNATRIVEAIVADFGERSHDETLLAEVFTSVSSIRYKKKNLRKWMKPQKRHVDAMFRPARARVVHQPKGVVGIIAPWNYPFFLAMGPLAAALAAGNRVLIKPSELTPRTASLLEEMISSAFPADVISVVTGGPDLGAAFSELPFDHLLFTGSTQLGKVIMAAAAKNLTPVTLELGGKSPLVVQRDYPIDKVATRIVHTKCFNGAQTCVAPDYLLVAEDRLDEIVQAIGAEMTRRFGNVYDSRDYTGVINERHFDRLQGYIDDARAKGARVIELNPPGAERPDGSRKIPLTLILGATDEMTVMQEEIFGPLLPIVTYRELGEAIRYVNERPRPLALYYFDNDADRIQRMLDQTTSGNACINEALFHVAVDDLPFGGVGASGMGAYHGREGFETFSHRKGVLLKGRFNSANFLLPPYRKHHRKGLEFLVG
jgi:coniferyl-aldehyde dehydrogenase